MGKVTDELRNMRIDDLARMARFKSNKWLLKRAITVCGPNQLGELLKHMEASFEYRNSRFESQQRWLNGIEDFGYAGRSSESERCDAIMHAV